jgi:xylulokinase
MYLGIDLGTSSVKTLLMDEAQTVFASESATLDVTRSHPGWAEQEPDHWIAATEATLSALAASHRTAMAAVKGIGLSGHMHGATLVDASDNILRPCMLWNDTRAHAQASRMDTESSRALTGNILFPGFTAPKVAWLAEHEPEIFERIDTVLLPKDHLRLWLTGERVSEMSDAAGTGWLDVAQRDWSDELLTQTGLSRAQMPTLVEGTAVSGKLRSTLATRFGLPNDVIVAGGAGDNAASACGMGTVAPGNAFVSLGTSGVLFAATERFMPNADSAVHAFCHAVPNTWHQMGVILAATDSLNWLCTVTGQTATELSAGVENRAFAPTDEMFLPYLGGERTPHNDAAARGVFTGLAHSSDAEALTAAVMQGVAFAFADCQSALAAAGTTLQRAYAIGGGSRSETWLNTLATVLDIPLDIPADGDFGAGLGAARLGLIAANNANAVDICEPPPVMRSIEPVAESRSEFQDALGRYRDTWRRLN